MQVMKFGGASVKNAEAVRNVGKIIRIYTGSPLVVVVSAMDKTTNHLELLAAAARDCHEEESWERFGKIRSFHYGIAEELFPEGNEELYARMEEQFAEIERIIRGLLLLGEFPSRTYDRIVSYGEMLSTTILRHHLASAGIDAAWLDARSILKTDANYKEAKVIWSETEKNVAEQLLPLLNQHAAVVTQGFIASSMEGKITTLGREGSDYTAAILAHCLDAESVTVWKDVAGVLNADPRIVPDALKHETLSYEQAVEMTFYGATVIHPKTIKPLYNKDIPLQVKCFSKLEESGTRITASLAGQTDSPLSSTIVKKGQVLMKIRSRDFSFMKTSLVSDVFRQISHAGAKVNLVQTTAVSLNLCLDNSENTLELESLLLDRFQVEVSDGFVLTTYLDVDAEMLKKVGNAEMVQFVEGKLFVVA